MSPRNFIITDFSVENVSKYDEYLREMGVELSGCVWQLEECPNTGKRHIQAYIETTKQYRITTLSKLIGSANHVEGRRGSRKQAVDYCSKADSRVDGPWFWPSKSFFESAGSGRRSDLITVCEQVRDGSIKTMYDLANAYPDQVVKYARGYRTLFDLRRDGNRDAPLVIVLNGEPGTGKSKWAADNTKGRDVYWKPPGKWWDGYRGQEIVVMDEFDSKDLSYRSLLRVLDRYPLRVEFKGGYCDFTSQTIIITSSIHYKTWYPLEKGEELERRIHCKMSMPRDSEWDLEDCEASRPN